jgi:hypothetical protein
MSTTFLPRALSAALAITLVALPVHAQAAAPTAAPAAVASAAPSFAGTWEINAAKSDFGQFPAPSKLTMTVEQSPTALKSKQVMSTPNGDFDTTLDLALDGKETTGTGFGGMTTKNVAKLDAGALVVNTKLQAQGAEMTQTSRWTLSPDGKMLTVAQSMTGPMGAINFTLVLDKKN